MTTPTRRSLPGRALTLTAAVAQLVAAFLPWTGAGDLAIDLGLVSLGAERGQPTVAILVILLAAAPALSALAGDRGHWRLVSGLGSGALVLAWLAAGPPDAMSAGPLTLLGAAVAQLVAAALAAGGDDVVRVGPREAVTKRSRHRRVSSTSSPEPVTAPEPPPPDPTVEHGDRVL